MAGPRNSNPLPDRHPGWDKWLRRHRAAQEDWQHSLGTSINQPSNLFIKGDVAFQILDIRLIKGLTEFAFESEYIKGDSDLVGQIIRYVKSETVFVFNAFYIKGEAALAVNIPLSDLGENPAATKPGAISRIWVQVKSVTKDVT